MKGDQTDKGRWCYASSYACAPHRLNHGSRSLMMAPPAAIHTDQATAHRPTLFLACELGVTTWKLGVTTVIAQRPRERTIDLGPPRHTARLMPGRRAAPVTDQSWDERTHSRQCSLKRSSAIIKR